MVDGEFTATQFLADIEGHPDRRAGAPRHGELAFFTREHRILGAYRAHPFRRRTGRGTDTDDRRKASLPGRDRSRCRFPRAAYRHVEPCGIGEHYRQIYGASIDWRQKARSDILAGGPELGYQNAVIVTNGGQECRRHGAEPAAPRASTFRLSRKRTRREDRTAHAADQRYLFIRELAVVPSQRGKGLGARLIEFALVHAAAIKAKGVGLTVKADNAPAVALYETNGFVEVTRVAIEGRDVLLMAIELARSLPEHYWKRWGTGIPGA